MSIVLNAIAVAVLGEESGSQNADLRANLLCHHSQGQQRNAIYNCQGSWLTEYFFTFL
jgi:hypothetical protein